jgi:hypothetical protein
MFTAKSDEEFPKVKVRAAPDAAFKIMSHPVTMIPLQVVDGTLFIVAEAPVNPSTSSSVGSPAGVHFVASFQFPVPPTQLRVCDQPDTVRSTIIPRE